MATLMKKEGRIGLKSIEDNLIAKTKLFEYSAKADTMLANMVRGVENFAMPTMDCFAMEICPDYGKELVNMYNGTMGLYDVVNEIPDDLKVLQASVFDSLCYGYNTGNETVSIYTLNLSLLGIDEDPLDDKFLKKVAEQNSLGIVVAYRVDLELVENTNDNSIYDFKLVMPRKPNIIDNENIVLVPILVGVRFFTMLKTYMDKKFVLMIKQFMSDGNLIKTRCVTENVPVIAKYSYTGDVSLPENLLKSKYDFLNATAYVPSIGAPCTTSMLTGIHPFAVTEIRRLEGASQLKEYGVYKDSKPMETEAKKSIIVRYLNDAALDSVMQVGYQTYINDCPRSDITNLFGASEAVVYSYLDSLNREELNDCVKRLPKNYILRAKKISEMYSCLRDATKDEIANIYDTLKQHVCKIMLKRKTAGFTSITCTNDSDCLKTIYGDDYFNKYESFGVRVKRMIYEMRQVSDLESLLVKYGFDVKMDALVNFTKENYGKVNDENLISGMYGIYSKKRKTSSDNDNLIMVRCTNATIGENGVVNEYYKFIDITKIERVLILS